MHLSRVDLNLFVVLDAIYAEGGITKAAHKLHLTQPAVSHALARLRELFKDPLFVRQGRAMGPTPLARSLMEPTRRALRGLELTLNETRAFDPAVTARRFTLGLRDVLEAVVLPPLLRRVSARAPAIDIAAVRFDRHALEADLTGGTLDAALDVLLPASPDIRHRRLMHDRLVMVARRGHPALRRKLDLPAYLKLDHVLVSSRRSGPGLEDLELQRRGLQRRIRLRCQHYFAACRAVSQTDLVLTMPERYSRTVNEHFGNRIVLLPFKTPTLDVYLYWHANVENEPAHRWLRQQLLQSIRA